MRILSLQSGTSADGIDVAVVDAEPDGDALHLVPQLTMTVDWEAALRADILAAAHGDALDAAAWCRLDTRLGHAFAEAAELAVHLVGPVDLVVSHGQTLYHWTEDGRSRGTLQLGDPAWIAERAAAPVLSHLRHADIAAGGAGAPLMAVFDRLWLAGRAAELGRPLATANLGGIANVQLVDADGAVRAFDTGPGNCLIDAVVHRETGAPFDADGRLAAAGAVDAALLAALARHPYFALPAPKTTGRETFDLALVDRALATHPRRPSTPDLVATLAELTAATVADALAEARPAELLVSGGGARNPVLLDRLAARAAEHGIRTRSSEDAGIDPDAKESIMFALLGWLSWHGVPIALGDTPARIAGRLAPGPGAFAVPAPHPGIRRIVVEAMPA